MTAGEPERGLQRTREPDTTRPDHPPLQGELARVADEVRRFAEQAVPRRVRLPLRVFLVIFVILVATGINLSLHSPWFYAYGAMAATAGFILWYVHQKRGHDARWVRRWLYWPGRVWKWLVFAVAGIAVFWRFSSLRQAVGFAVAYVLTVLLLAWFVRLRQPGFSDALNEFYGVAGWMFLVPWVLDSLCYLAVTVLFTDAHSPYSIRQAAKNEHALVERGQRWKVAGGRTVALTLSGGGYRAALVHAGVLSVLDDAGVPIAYLSTVSGGSIVGASYAMGVSPHAFTERLARRRPSLPDDFMNFFFVFARLTSSEWGTGDIYTGHFDRRFFHGAALEQTGPPALIVNATSYREGKRVSFWRARAGSERLARAVAASGAFPVAFDPVRIGGERYFDGGVVENLGVAGLHEFLAASRRDAVPLPDVVVISDVSAVPEPRDNFRKASLIQMAAQAQQASYTALHERVYERYTDGRYNRRNPDSVEAQPYLARARNLWGVPWVDDKPVRVFVLGPTTPAEHPAFSPDGLRCAKSVGHIDTLTELDRGQVERAFWVGAAVARVYLPMICIVAQVSCRDLPPTPPPDCEWAD